MSSTLRQSSGVAHVAPLMLFMALLTVPDFFRVENPELPWYQKAPEHWLYPIQTLLCAGLLFHFRAHYQLKPWRGLALAVTLGVIGIAAWIAPSWWFEKIRPEGSAPDWWSWFGLVDRTHGFDPTVLAAWPWAEKASIAIRFLRMVIVVPLVEELFWRGFMMRYLNAGDGPWQSVPFGTHTWKAFGIVTVLVILIHQPEDYLAALVWGTLIYWLAVRSRSLGACVIMHAVGNLILGIYTLRTQNWGLW